mgnify:CR=1 FL=1
MLGGLTIVAAAAGTALAMAPGGQVSAGDRTAIEQIVHDYILEHPEIIPEAVEKLQQKKLSAVIGKNRTAIETPYGGSWEGNEKGDVTLVEFFDYNCSYCRASLNDLAKLAAGDKGLKIVYRELPILSQESNDAAKVSMLAAEKGQNAYISYHKSLYAAGPVTKATIMASAQKAGIDRASAESAIASKKYDAAIEDNIRLAQQLQASGTPTFVVGNQVFAGAVGYDALKAAIADARGK